MSNMKGNTKVPDPVCARSTKTTSGIRKQVHKRIPYRVGYTWNKGGRLKELRIRHLARKFLNIWIHNTFGRIPPHKARSFYASVLLRRAFEGWREEWWTSRREWMLSTRAECHCRYNLCSRALNRWQQYVWQQREKKAKVKMAQSFADKKRLVLVWDRWEVFTQMGRIKSRMVDTALKQNRLLTMHSAWRVWQRRLLYHRALHRFEDQAVRQREQTLQSQAFLKWKKTHMVVCCLKQQISKATLHFSMTVKRKNIHRWASYVTYRRRKKRKQAIAQSTHHLLLVKMFWSKWRNRLDLKMKQETCLQAAPHLAVHSIQRRALLHWRTYVVMCRQAAERKQMVCQYHHHHLLRVGLQGLSLNITYNKAKSLNVHMANKLRQQTLLRKHWKMWQERLEQAEDQRIKPLAEKAVKNYRFFLLRSSFPHWRERLAEKTHIQELEHCADDWFVQHTLPRSFKVWFEFTQSQRKCKQEKAKAAVFNRQRQLCWAFYTWWEQSEKHKEEMLSERMAILHEERGHLQRVWDRWRQRMQQRIKEAKQLEAAHHLDRYRLLLSTMSQWKEKSAALKTRRMREQQACYHGDLRLMRVTVEKWMKFVGRKQVKKRQLEGIQNFHDVRLLKRSFDAWKKHHQQIAQIYVHADGLYRQQSQRFLRNILLVWRENAARQAENRAQGQQAQNHFDRLVKLKMFLAWRTTTSLQVSKRRQQQDVYHRAQISVNQARLLHYFRHWRTQTHNTRMGRIYTGIARRHYTSYLLRKTLKAWNSYHQQHQKNKVRKRQGNLLLRLKLYQSFFDSWRVKLQQRRREIKQTELSLWHWSLTLQAKVLYAWRFWVTEQRRLHKEAASAAQMCRDQLLREGVTCILTYAAQMNDLTTDLTQDHQVKKSRRLQRVVKRCATEWKQRALRNAREESRVNAEAFQKSVTFRLPEVNHFSSSAAAEQDSGDTLLSNLLLTRRLRRQPRRCEALFASSLHMSGVKSQTQNVTTCSEEAVKSKSTPSQEDCLAFSAFHLSTSTQQRGLTSTASPSDPHTSIMESTQETQNHERLLPPSAFMTTGIRRELQPLQPSGPNASPLQPFCELMTDHSSPPGDGILFGETPQKPINGRKDERHENRFTASSSVLLNDLLNLQVDMKEFQFSRKKLRAWRKLKEVLKTWLETSGKDDEEEKQAVVCELQELERHINKVSTELERQKPKMLQYTERIQHLQSALEASGVTSLWQQVSEMEANLCLTNMAANNTALLPASHPDS